MCWDRLLEVQCASYYLLMVFMLTINWRELNEDIASDIKKKLQLKSRLNHMWWKYDTMMFFFNIVDKSNVIDHMLCHQKMAANKLHRSLAGQTLSPKTKCCYVFGIVWTVIDFVPFPFRYMYTQWKIHRPFHPRFQCSNTNTVLKLDNWNWKLNSSPFSGHYVYLSCIL